MELGCEEGRTCPFLFSGSYFPVKRVLGLLVALALMGIVVEYGPSVCNFDWKSQIRAPAGPRWS